MGCTLKGDHSGLHWIPVNLFEQRLCYQLIRYLYIRNYIYDKPSIVSIKRHAASREFSQKVSYLFYLGWWLHWELGAILVFSQG